MNLTLSKLSFYICMTCIVFSVALTAYIFEMSRTDPGLRMAALVGASNIATALMATASTLLTGKDLSNNNRHPDPGDLPPGSVTTEQSTVQTPPVTTPIPPTTASN